MLVPNSLAHFCGISVSPVALPNDVFLQEAARVVLPVVDNVERYLAVTYHLAEARMQRAPPNNLQPNRRNGCPLRRLFIWCADAVL